MKKLAFLGLILLPFGASTQVVINEYSCSNMSVVTDGTGDYSDWAELYNSGATALDIGGYFLSDKAGNITKWAIPAGASVPAGGFTRIFFNGQGSMSGADINAGFKLTQTKNEYIILTAPGGSVVDSLRMIKMTQKDHSLARTTDGGATWGIDQSPTPGASNITVDNYYTVKPTLSIAPGFYPGSQTINMISPDPLATIYYTTDGTVPTTGSLLYTTPVNIAATTVVRARAFSSDPSTPPSFVETNTYFIGVTHTVPVLSVCGDQITDFLNDSAPGSFTTNFDGAYEYFEADGSFIDEGTGYYNKHGNDSWAYDQRGFDLVVRDEYGSNYAVQHEVFQEKDRDEYQKIIIKAAANDNYSFEDGAHIRDAYIHTLSQIAGLRVDERTSRFAVVYVDGEYWGLYDLREKVDDHDFTDHYYDQGRDDIDFIKTWGATWEEYGSRADWDDLVDYIMTNDMTVDANYDYVSSQLNCGSLIDYVVLNSFIVSSDWLVWNTAWWRGRNPDGDKKKWRYVLWDLDATFGHYINYTGIPSTAADADPCDPETLAGDTGADPEGHIAMVEKLKTNEDFNQEYITRFADLANGAFSCEHMIEVLDSMVAVMDPEMTAQCTKWGGTYAGWQDNVQALRDYINARCASISSGLIDCFDLTGPFDLTINVDPPGAGVVKVNSEWVPYYEWTGVYYGNINTLFKADPNGAYLFDYWESTNHTLMYPDSLRDTLDLSSSDSIIAHFRLPEEPPTIPPATYAGFHLPTGFSPNGDGTNDLLEFFVGYDVVVFDLMIFDRWGNLVFRTSSIGDYWDGYYKGKLLNTGIYTYSLTYTLSETGSQQKTGNITLMR